MQGNLPMQSVGWPSCCRGASNLASVSSLIHDPGERQCCAVVRSGKLTDHNILLVLALSPRLYWLYKGVVEARIRGCHRNFTMRSVLRWLTMSVLLGWPLACAGTQIPKAQIASPAQGLFNGQVRAEVNCYSCHNGDASGTWRGPNLAERVPKLTDAAIALAIAEGPGLMPSFKGKLSDAEVTQLISWLRTKFPH